MMLKIGDFTLNDWCGDSDGRYQRRANNEEKFPYICLFKHPSHQKWRFYSVGFQSIYFEYIKIYGELQELTLDLQESMKLIDDRYYKISKLKVFI